MKKLILFVVLTSFIIDGNAQKIKQTEGKLSFLKGQTDLSISFERSNDLKVGKYTEAKYIEVKMEKANDNEPGTGEKWKESWDADPSLHYYPKFLELINSELEDKGVAVKEDNSNATYKMNVVTTFIEPGYNVGVSRKNASINLIIFLVAVDNPDEVLAKFTIDKSPGRTAFGSDFDTGTRVAEAYAKAAKEFAGFLLKKKAF